MGIYNQKIMITHIYAPMHIAIYKMAIIPSQYLQSTLKTRLNPRLVNNTPTSTPHISMLTLNNTFKEIYCQENVITHTRTISTRRHVDIHRTALVVLY